MADTALEEVSGVFPAPRYRRADKTSQIRPLDSALEEHEEWDKSGRPGQAGGRGVGEPPNIPEWMVNLGKMRVQEGSGFKFKSSRSDSLASPLVGDRSPRSGLEALMGGLREKDSAGAVSDGFK